MTSIFLPPSQSRLVTICAHVDHGKTTLADSLIESNGIISERLAGTLRYLDFLEEEQRRGITMRASAIGLKHRYHFHAGSKKKNTTSSSEDVIVHLLDSPGHTDFSTEVSSCLQCCDGCLLVVDAVEGICARTHQVIREAHLHQLVPILVVNKVDRLCTELRLTATEGYVRLRTLIESINATTAAMLVSKRAEASNDGNHNNKDVTKKDSQKNNDDVDDEEESRWTFDPSKGNVVFASALYGWGFTVPSLCRSLFKSKILPIKPPILKQFLFGDFKYKAASKKEEEGKVLKWKQDSNSNSDENKNTPLFAEFALKPIWEIYEGVATAAESAGCGSSLFSEGRSSAISTTTGTKAKKGDGVPKIKATAPGMDKVLEAMTIGSTYQQQPNQPSLSSANDVQTILTNAAVYSEEPVLRCLLRRYRPLSSSILDAVYEHCPSPNVASSSVRPRALAFQQPSMDDLSGDSNSVEKIQQEFERIQHATKQCDISPSAPTVAYICKFMATDRSHVRDPGHEDYDDSSSSTIILGLARVLSGTLKTGNEYHVMGPKHAWNLTSLAAEKRKIRLYLVMGSSFVHVKEVPAGHLCAIQNLEDVQLKTATLCDSPYGMPLQGFNTGIRPLVKVNVETVNPRDTSLLERGLLRLSLADPAVEVTATAKGERILACLGELHLEQSILDLKKVYCVAGKSNGGNDIDTGEGQNDTSSSPEIQLRVSEPIVEFGETSDWFYDMNEHLDYQAFFDSNAPPLRQCSIPPYNEEEGLEMATRGRARAILSGRVAAISLRVIPLSPNIYASLVQGKLVGDCKEDLEVIGRALGMQLVNKDNVAESVFRALKDSHCSLDESGNAIIESLNLSTGVTARCVFSENGEVAADVTSKEANEVEGTNNDEKEGEFDRTNAPNVAKDDFLLVRERIRKLGFGRITPLSSPSSAGENHGQGDNNISVESQAKVDANALDLWKTVMRGSVVAGFHMAVRAGPICEEPVRGVMVVLEGVEIAAKERRKQGGESHDPAEPGEAATKLIGKNFQTAKPLSGGMVVAALRLGIRCALLTRPTRLMESHLKLTLNSSLAGLGPLYSVLSKRRGKVLEDSMVDGTDLLLITATLPHAESFGLAPELFRKSSGEVTAPELIFSHWDRFDEDPFWIPTSLEEREDYGEILQNGDVSTGMDNTAIKYIRTVRERKGLLVDSSRTVIAAEKQRTLKR